MITDRSTWRTYGLPVKQPAASWSVLKKQEHLCAGIDDVRHKLAHWNPLSRMLVGQPGASQFAVPCDVPLLSAELVARTRRTLAIGAFGWTFLAAMAILMYLRSNDNYFLGFAGMAAVMASLSCSERWFGLSDWKGLSQRSVFFYWLRTAPSPRTSFFAALVIGLLAGVCQVLVQTKLEGFEALIEEYGFYYQSVRQGEHWRVLTVPFLHASVPHFLSNLTLLAFIAPVAGALAGARGVVAVTLVGCFAGAYSQMWLGPGGDAQVGASAGILALYAHVTGLSLLRVIDLPKGFVWVIATVAVASVLGAGLFSTTVANAAHLTGLFVGGVWSLAHIGSRLAKNES